MGISVTSQIRSMSTGSPAVWGRYRQASADALGEIRRIARRLCSGVDVAQLLEFRKGHAGVEPAYFVNVLRGVAAQENFPVVPRLATSRLGMEQDGGGAVRGQGVVERRVDR